MKNIFFIVLFSVISLSSFAQYREVERRDPESDKSSGGFQKDHLFTGGGVLLSLSNYNFGVGVSPVLGYSFNKWFDAGIGINFTYISQRDGVEDQYGNLYTNGNKVHQTDIAPIVFAKFYPFKFLFLQVQAEHNIISQKYIYGSGAPSDKVKYGVTSLMPGIGYCGGREGVGDFFYYISLSVDVLKNVNSPYVQRVYDSNGYASNQVNILPILRAGIQVPLFQGKK